MRVTLNEKDVFISTGGRALERGRKTLLFFHGSGQSHLTFLLQGRYFANRGFNVINADMPAHGGSEGPALQTIEEMAEWYAELVNLLGFSSVCTIGHSQGGLTALEMTAKHPNRVEKCVFMATALSIPVNAHLINMAQEDEVAAIAAMVDWGNGTKAHHHTHSLPGANHLNFGKALMSENEKGALHADLKACDAYKNGPNIAKAITHDALVILAKEDKMTPLKTGKSLANSLQNAQTHTLNAGHMLPSEAPDEVNKILLEFLKA